MRRLRAAALVAGLRDQRAKTRTIEPGILGREGVQGLGLGDQAFAPLLEGVLAGRVDVVAMRPETEPTPDRLGVDVAHQLADKLELPFAATPGGDRACFADRLAQPLRQRDFGRERGKALRFQQHERFSHVLQRVHFRLASCLRRRRMAGFRARRGRCRGIGVGARARTAAFSFVGPGHRSGGNPWGRGR